MLHNLNGLLAARSKATVPSYCQSRSAGEAQTCFCLIPGHYAHPAGMSLVKQTVRQAWTGLLLQAMRILAWYQRHPHVILLGRQ